MVTGIAGDAERTALHAGAGQVTDTALDLDAAAGQVGTDTVETAVQWDDMQCVAVRPVDAHLEQFVELVFSIARKHWQVTDSVSGQAAECLRQYSAQVDALVRVAHLA